MLRVALAGAQDTGKTTLARGLAAYFSAAGRLTEYVPEYAREFIGQYGALSNAELLVILKQIEKELLVSPKAEVMFTDSPIFLAYVYTLHLGQPNDPSLWVVLDTIMQLINRHPPYDIVLYLPTFREPRADGIRSPQLISENNLIAQRIIGYLDLFNVSYTRLDMGNLQQRMEQAIALIEATF